MMSRLFGTTKALRAWAIASLLGNMALIVTGAVVRLTDSGLGCSTWPHCTPGSFVPRGALTIHSAIEFGNRTLTFVLAILAVGTLIAAYRVGADRLTKTLSWVGLAGIPAQGVLGGITVLTKLNPFVVAMHLVLSVALVIVLVRLVAHVVGRSPLPVPRAAHSVAAATFGMGLLAIWLGTLVTGSGPNAGDHGATRTGFDIETIARIHAGSVWLTVGLTVATIVVVRRLADPTRPETRRPFRAAVTLLVVELAQGAIGYIQYFTHLPVQLVIWHMVGVSVFSAALAWLLFSVRA